MPVALPLTDSKLDSLRLALVRYFAKRNGLAAHDELAFEPFEDGRMGSFKVLDAFQDGVTEKLVDEASFIDLDRTVVVITVFCGTGSQISSLAFWRVDFSPILAFPEPRDLLSSLFPKTERAL